MPWAPSYTLGNWGSEKVYVSSAAVRSGGERGFISVFRQGELLVGTSFLIQSRKRWELPLNVNFFFTLSLGFTTGEPGQFQSSYGKFLRCDKDSLDVCSIDFYGMR